MDNDSIRGSPMHMAHHMVKAYGLNENCTFFAISEPAFYGKIKWQQKIGRPKQQNIWNKAIHYRDGKNFHVWWNEIHAAFNRKLTTLTIFHKGKNGQKKNI